PRRGHGPALHRRIRRHGRPAGVLVGAAPPNRPEVPGPPGPTPESAPLPRRNRGRRLPPAPVETHAKDPHRTPPPSGRRHFFVQSLLTGRASSHILDAWPARAGHDHQPPGPAPVLPLSAPAPGRLRLDG